MASNSYFMAVAGVPSGGSSPSVFFCCVFQRHGFVKQDASSSAYVRLCVPYTHLLVS
ncbi:MAG TPA: hypothetical protein VKA38_05830 [Draconibacterium sp.]|nr:hypothetical protein [Draconibacterium sp.]